MKKFLKISFILIVLVYFGLFLSYKNGYYINKNTEKMILTEEKINEYEDDLKNGVDVTKKDYVVVKDSYDNSYTRLSLKLSKKIENGINKVIKYLFNKIGQTVNENN